MTFENFLQNILGISPLFVLKIFTLLGFLLYLIFALVVVRQVQLMSQVVGSASQKGIRFITLIHLVAIVLLLVLALFL